MLGTRETTTKKISGWNWGSTHKFKVPKTSLKIVFLESKLQFLEISEYPPILKKMVCSETHWDWGWRVPELWSWFWDHADGGMIKMRDITWCRTRKTAGNETAKQEFEVFLRSFSGGKAEEWDNKWQQKFEVFLWFALRTDVPAFGRLLLSMSSHPWLLSRPLSYAVSRLLWPPRKAIYIHLCHPQVMARWVGVIPSRIIGVEDKATKTMGCPTGCAILQSEVSMGFMPLKNHKLKPQVAIELVALNNCSCKACAASALLGWKLIENEGPKWGVYPHKGSSPMDAQCVASNMACWQISHWIIAFSSMFAAN